MAASGLTANQSTDFFRQRILLNAKYWQEYVSDKAADITALEGSRELIVRAIAFALDLTEAWQLVYDLMVAFSPFMERRGHWEIWQQLLDRATQQVENTAHNITLSALLARLLQRQSQFTQAISHYRRIIHLARQTGNLYEEARACTNLGYFYVEDGHWHRAEVLCCHALNIFESINNHYGCAHTENHLGLLYSRRQIWERAKFCLEQASMLWQTMDDHHGSMRSLINLGVLHNDMEQYDEALSYLSQALQLARQTGEEAEIGKIYLNMGVAYGQKGELVQAESLLWQAEAIFQRFFNSLNLALTWINLGIIYIEQKKWGEAREYLEIALVTCQSLKNGYGKIEALQGLVEFELAQGNQEQAMKRLIELKCLVQPRDWEIRYQRLKSLLLKYRRNPFDYPLTSCDGLS